MFESIVVAGYAALLGIGGVIGYFQAASIPSLVMGLGSSILLWLCSKAITAQNPRGYFYSLSLTVVLSAFFIYRFAASWKVMPSGAMALVSVGVLIILLRGK